jgi:4-amino-4-deoxy-L-arabinose transferase-like glycosyltransferase
MSSTGIEMRSLVRKFVELDRYEYHDNHQIALVALILLLLIVVSWFALSPLVDRYYVEVFEPDAESTIELSLAFADGSALRGLPAPYYFPPYFDAQYIVYALGILLTKALLLSGSLDPSALPTQQSVAIFGIRHVNLIAHASATAVVFATCARLAQSLTIGALLAVVFLLSPHLLHIDMMRVDRIIMFFFVVVVYLSILVAKQRKAITVDILLGMSSAALVMTKVTSIVFLSAPIVAYVYTWRIKKQSPKHVSAFVISFVLASIFLLMRFLPHEIQKPGFIVRTAIEKIADVERWSSIISKTPYLYYNVDQFLPYGIIFLTVFAGSLVILCAATVRMTDLETTLILLLFLSVSAFGVASFKYERGTYVLVPIYLYVMARAVSSVEVWQSQNTQRHFPSRLLMLAVISIALVISLHSLLDEYRRAKAAASARTESVRITRLMARDWLRANAPEGVRVAMMFGAKWANPPISDLGFKINSKFFDFPYLDPRELAKYVPPEFDDIEQTYDVIIINDFHKSYLLHVMQMQGHNELVSKWTAFYEELPRRYFHKRFEADSENYGVKAVDIYLIKRRTLSSRGLGPYYDDSETLLIPDATANVYGVVVYGTAAKS